MSIISKFLYSQLFVTPPYPKTSFSGQTVIVTGSNVGLGFEAARHIARLDAALVILAVRNLEKGEAARQSILSSTNRPAASVQVWQLDLCSYASVKAFAARVDKELPRLDAIVENAGIVTHAFRVAEDCESTITTNVVSTFLLALLVLPKLKATAAQYNTRPRLVIVSSEVHFFTSFPEQAAPPGGIFALLNDPATARMADRYNVSKLLEVFAVREITRTKAAAPDYPVTINFLNPGLCHSELARESGWLLYFMKLLLARSTEVGSRTLVHAAAAGPETHGAYLSDCEVRPPAPLVLSQQGGVVQARVWEELAARLEKISPGVEGNL